MEPSQYEKQALEVAQKIGIEVIAAYQGNQCPEWAGTGERLPNPYKSHGCSECGDMHGDKYRVTIKRVGKKGSVSFDYWASWADCNVEITGKMVGNGPAFKKTGLPYYDANKYFVGNVVKRKHTPSYYDILCCVSSDASGPTDPDEVVREYGNMLPSRAIAIAAHARKLQTFFTADELTLLTEVQ